MANIKEHVRIVMIILLICVLVATAVLGLMVWWENRRDPYAGEPLPTIALPEPDMVEELPEPVDVPPEEVEDNLPHDKLFITAERYAYQDHQLTLVIPKLEKILPVAAGVGEEDLRRNVGLYDYAQLPGSGNRNVSIAGHRNTSRAGIITDNAPFYYIDTLGEGDYLYLVDAEKIYRYTYEETYVVEADDWGPIYSQGYSCLTLTSCTPIGVATQRIIVRGRLDEIFDYQEDFPYVAQVEEPTA